jgi:ketosteroid isomerase-like protein
MDMKHYSGRIPACGVFCGGCPIYTREKNPCPGAAINFQRCEKCKTLHLCCKERSITHCYECTVFPCSKFRSFAKRWLKYGQDFIENQKLLKHVGEVLFLAYYNAKTDEMQKQIDIETIALQFNDCINKQDLTGLVNLMTDDHIFIDSTNNQVIGKSSNKENWQKFFHLFPDYRTTFEVVSSTGSTVIMQGYSVCSNNRLNSNRAIWVARIANDKLAEWRVYLDNEENRHFLGL